MYCNMQTGLLLRSEQLCFYIPLPLEASFSTATLSAGLGKRTISVCNFFKKRLQQVLASGRKEMNAAPHIPKGQNLQFNSHSVSIFFFFWWWTVLWLFFVCCFFNGGWSESINPGFSYYACINMHVLQAEEVAHFGLERLPHTRTMRHLTFMGED